MHLKNTCGGMLLALMVLQTAGPGFAQTRQVQGLSKGIDLLDPLAPGAVQIAGHIGTKIDQCIDNRIMVQDVPSLIKVFEDHTDGSGNYHGEFYGKWAAAAALSCRYEANPVLQQRMENANAELIATRGTNGYITSYIPGALFHVWDVWDQKYVLLGLLAQYDETGDKSLLEAAEKSADYLIASAGPGKKISLEQYGPSFHKGGANYSILEPIVMLYERTGKKKYLDYGQYIVDSWSQPSLYTPHGVRLIENAEAGVPLVDYEVRHAYVLMSNFEGVCEMYRATGKKKYLDASVKVAGAIEKYELAIDGTMSNHEIWCNGALQQTGYLEAPNETCATVTWMRLCYQLLVLTGDPAWADQMETSLYNGLLGAMMPKGQWWAYNSPIYGERIPSRVQGVNLSCCVSSGPRGLLMTPQWALMRSLEGALVVNLYSDEKASVTLAGGRKVDLTLKTDYPLSGVVHIRVDPAQPGSFPLKLRIPAWSKKNGLLVNGKSVPVTPGTYATITRTWKAGDQVTLTLDVRGRIVRAPGGGTDQAVLKGPIVLAMDNRLAPEQDSAIWLIKEPWVWTNYAGRKSWNYILPNYNYPAPGEDAYVDLTPVTPSDTSIWMAFQVPFITRPALQISQVKKVVMCDFSSAGNQWSEDNYFRVWLPQPLYMDNMYAKNSWKSLVYGAKVRPKVPQYIQDAVRDR